MNLQNRKPCRLAPATSPYSKTRMMSASYTPQVADAEKKTVQFAVRVPTGRHPTLCVFLKKVRATIHGPAM